MWASLTAEPSPTCCLAGHRAQGQAGPRTAALGAPAGPAPDPAGPRRRLSRPQPTHSGRRRQRLRRATGPAPRPREPAAASAPPPWSRTGLGGPLPGLSRKAGGLGISMMCRFHVQPHPCWASRFAPEVSPTCPARLFQLPASRPHLLLFPPPISYFRLPSPSLSTHGAEQSA